MRVELLELELEYKPVTAALHQVSSPPKVIFIHEKLLSFGMLNLGKQTNRFTC